MRELPEQKWGKSGSWVPLWRNHSCRGTCASGRWCSSGSWQSWHSAERSWARQRDLRWTPPLRSWCCWTGEGSQRGWRDRLHRWRHHQRRPLHRCSGTLNPRLVGMGTTWLLNKTGGETSKEPHFLTRDYFFLNGELRSRFVMSDPGEVDTERCVSYLTCPGCPDRQASRSASRTILNVLNMALFHHKSIWIEHKQCQEIQHAIVYYYKVTFILKISR